MLCYSDQKNHRPPQFEVDSCVSVHSKEEQELKRAAPDASKRAPGAPMAILALSGAVGSAGKSVTYDMDSFCELRKNDASDYFSLQF